MTEGPQSLKSFLPGPFQKQAASRSQLRAAHTSVTHGPQQGLSRSKMCFHFLVSLGQLGANITIDSALPIGTKALQSWFSCSALLSPKTQENRSMTFKSRRCILSLLLPPEEGPRGPADPEASSPGFSGPDVPPSLWPHPLVTCLAGNQLGGVRAGAEDWGGICLLCVVLVTTFPF